MLARLFKGKSQSKLHEDSVETSTDKCANNCDRYVSKGSTTCCNSCTGLNDTHTNACTKDNSYKDIDVYIALKTFDTIRFYVHICKIKQVPIRLMNELTQLINQLQFAIGKTNINVGTDDNKQIKLGEFFNKDSSICIHGPIIPIIKKYIKFMKKFVEQNELVDSTVFSYEDLHTKDYYVINLGTDNFKSQLCYMYYLEAEDFKYKPLITIQQEELTMDKQNDIVSS